MYDWSALRKHISSGQCSRLKSRAATGQSLDEMWREVERQENVDLPSPPHGLDSGQAAPEEVWLQMPLRDVLSQVALLATLRRACAICGQRLISMQKIKTHWRQTHAVAWRCVQAEIEGEMASLQAVVKKPCQFCGSTAADSGAHSRQCATLFQLLATRSLARLGRLHQVRELTTGTQRRQDKANPAYASYRIENSPIGQALRLTKGPSAARQGATDPVVSAAMGAEMAGVDNGLSQGGAALVWTARLTLVNPGNHCYANASILAVCHACAMARYVPTIYTSTLVLIADPATTAASSGWVLTGFTPMTLAEHCVVTFRASTCAMFAIFG